SYPANPYDWFTAWFDEAKSHPEIKEPTAMSLAAATKDGKPSLRIVLLKNYDERGFAFYTNYNSRKGRELQDNPFAALTFYWMPLWRQIRIEGAVEKVSVEEADAYFATRPRISQLGAWAGLRPEEAAPQKSKLADGRRGVSWEDIDFDFNIIRISPETAKVERPRIVPMCAELKAFLLPLRGTGAICQGNPVHDKTLVMLGEKVFGGRWPADCLRHSYGSYRNAEIRNLTQVAEEMGTSVEMLHRHYHNPRPGHEAALWFAALGDKQEVSNSG
ncbi:pyridoxamine 5'-phosphate oxidase, partial [bacterium]|nr:pyridoxamine 5'-phosphate oxidase [bacterium]